MSWIVDNANWIFSGIGAVLAAGAFKLFLGRSSESNPEKIGIRNDNSSNNNQVVNVFNVTSTGSENKITTQDPANTKPDAVHQSVKETTRILFIDDDVKFKVVKILQAAGWKNVSLVKDLGSLNDQILLDANIVFVDIQGVGRLCGFKDEGLGLAAAIKQRYPNKKLVIYSAEPRGAMFHDALRKADFTLEKNADPYEFEQLVDRFSVL